MREAATGTKTQRTRLGDVVSWFALKTAAAPICARLSRGRQREHLEVGRAYPIKLRVTGTANGTPIDQAITGRLTRDADRKIGISPGAVELLAEALGCVGTPARLQDAVRRLQRGTAKATQETLAMAQSIIEARRTESTRAGDVHFTPAN